MQPEQHRPTTKKNAPRGYAGGGAEMRLADDSAIRTEYSEVNKIEKHAHETTGAPQSMKGTVRGPKGKDKVPAWLTADEYVLPEKTVDAMGGPGALDRLVEATNGKKPGGKPVERDNSVFGFSGGGAVDKAIDGVQSFRKNMREKHPMGNAIDKMLQMVPLNVPYAAADVRERAREGDIPGVGVEMAAAAMPVLKLGRAVNLAKNGSPTRSISSGRPASVAANVAGAGYEGQGGPAPHDETALSYSQIAQGEPVAMKGGRGGAKQMLVQGFAGGGAVESTKDMIARISAKYGTGHADPSPQQKLEPEPEPQKPAEKPPARHGLVKSAVNILSGRRRQLDAALGYEGGGGVDEFTPGDDEVDGFALGGSPGASVDDLTRRAVDRANAEQAVKRAAAPKPVAANSLQPTRGMTLSEAPAPRPAAPPTAAPATAPTAAPAAQSASPKSQATGKAVGRLTNMAGKVAVTAPIAGFGDYKINDEGVDSSLSGTVSNIAQGNFAGAVQGLKQGAVEAGLDSVGGITKGIDFAAGLVGANPELNRRFDERVRGDLGPMLAPRGGAADVPAPQATPQATPQAPPPVGATPESTPATPAAPATTASAESVGAVNRLSDEKSYENLRNGMGRAIDPVAPVGREGLIERGSAGLRALASDDGLRGQMNDQYQRDNLGVKASTDANGRMVFSDAPIDPSRPTTHRGITTVPAESFKRASGSAGAGLTQALNAAAARGDFESIRAHYQRNGGTFNGETAAQSQQQRGGGVIGPSSGAADRMTMEQLLKLNPKRRRDAIELMKANDAAQNARETNAAGIQKQAMSDAAALGRSALTTNAEGQETTNATARLELERQQRVAGLQDRIINPKSEADAAAATKTLQLLVGKEGGADKFMAVDVDTGQKDALGNPIFAKTLFNTTTQQYVTPQGGQKQKVAPTEAITDLRQAVKNNDRSAIAEFEAIFGQGSAARYIEG